MKISYRIPIYQNGGLSGIRYLRNDPDEWRRLVFNPYRLHLLDQLRKYGEADDYGYWLNDMQGRHSNLYKAAQASGDWQSVAYRSDDVGKYQLDYRGGIDNNGAYKRYGSVSINPEDRYNFNESGIRNAQNNNRYDFFGPSKRLESDRGNSKYLIDNLYSGITDDRRILGRKGDWNEDSDEYKSWQKDLNSTGWEMYLDSDDYYKLRRLPTPENPSTNPNNPESSTTKVDAINRKYGFDWAKLEESFLKILSNPDLYATGRLIGNLANNERVYGESLKGIRPVLRLTYNTHRQVVGDEATKQAYYRRAAQGLTKAARPFTSDADRQMAYQFEAKRVGDELRAQGDLADNLEIRRTSDESNQHQWANTLRATEVANANIASINQANALRHNLLALKHAALWSSIDNFLKNIEYRKRQQFAEQQALEDLLFLLDLEDFQYTPEYAQEYKLYNDVLEKHKNTDGTYDLYNPEVVKARSRFLDFIKQHKKQQLLDLYNYKRNRISFTKSGGKVTHKKKDDLLYKSTRDVVEHFRKMSKMSSDAHNRRLPKIEKLTPHPKTRKYLQGGLAPFTIYTPVALGGETTTSTSAGSSSTTGSSRKLSEDSLDLMKELFKSLAVEGLPSDVNGIYKAMNNLMLRQQLFGNELSSSDIASMYIQQMLKINTIKFNKAQYDNTLKIVNDKNAESEYAIDLYGRIAVQNEDNGKVEYKKWSELKEALSNGDSKYNPLTNGDLLNLRAYDPSQAFSVNLLQVASNATSMTEISKFLKENLPKIEDSETTIEGYTKSESNDIKLGLLLLRDPRAAQVLLQNAPQGDYKFTEYSKDLLKQAQMALNYLKGILPKNMRTLLEVNSELNGILSDYLLTNMIGSQVGSNYKLEFDAVTGKASNSKNGTTNDSSEKIKSNPIMQMILQQGGVPRTWDLITRDSNIKMSVDGTFYSQIPKITEDVSIDKMLSESGLQGVLDSKQGITFGDLKVLPEQLKDIMYSNTGAMVVTLPCKIINGHKEVNLGVKETYEEAVLEVESKGISKNSQEYYKVLGNILKQKGLTSLLDNNGYPDRNKFGQFLIVEAYTTDKLKNLDTSSQYIEKVNNPDDELEQRLIKALSTNDKKDNYKLDINYWIYGDDVYRGTVFIPLTNNLNAATNAWGDLIKVEDAIELENKFQNFNKASNMKPSSSDVL